VHHVEVVSVASEKSDEGHRMVLELRLLNMGQRHAVMTDVEALPGVEVRTVNTAEEP